VLVAVVAGILVYRNPAGAAHLASGIHHAITTFCRVAAPVRSAVPGPQPPPGAADKESEEV